MHANVTFHLTEETAKRLSRQPRQLHGDLLFRDESDKLLHRAHVNISHAARFKAVPRILPFRKSQGPMSGQLLIVPTQTGASDIRQCKIHCPNDALTVHSLITANDQVQIEVDALEDSPAGPMVVECELDLGEKIPEMTSFVVIVRE